MLGTLQPTVQRFKLGGFELTTILDGVVARDGPHPTFGANVPAEDLHRLAEANRLPSKRFQHNFIPAVVDTGRELILFDTGNGEERRKNGVGNLRTLLPLAGYAPEDIDLVVITHGHGDHIAGLVEAGKPAFPNARYVFGRVEFDYWRKGDNVRDRRKANREQFVEICVPLAERSTFVEPGAEIAPGIHAVEAHGHSIGHMAYHLESAGQRLLLWADTSNHYVVSLQVPDWHGDFDDDKDQAVTTRKRILDMAATEKLWVAGFHMPFPGVGFVERRDGGYRWTPGAYQLSI
jgi:glyoxylase-like metal-dependent hydrolase (beta-lactamase superfamily II)